MNLHLEVRDILQHIKNAIDDEALWIKHYENLREIEKDLPEDSQETKPLDELLISDFLCLELKIYGISNDNKNTMELVISKIKDIEKIIPMVFNFKERLKLVLCAVSHISLEQTNYSYDDIVDKFKNLDEIKMLDGNTNASEQNSDIINRLKIFLAEKEEIVNKHESIIGTFQKSIKASLEANAKSLPKIPVTRSMTKTRGGAINEGPQNININTFFEGIKTLGEKNPLKELFNLYDLNGDYTDDEKENMFQNFVWINFSSMKKKYHEKQLGMLNNGFKSYIDNTPSMDELDGRVKSSLDKLDGFALFKKFLPKKSFNQEWFVKYFEQHAPILSLILGKKEVEGVEEAKGEEAAAAAKLQEVFNKYIEKVFEYSYAKLLIEKNIIKEEIDHQKKVEEQKGRLRVNISSDFTSANDPLLRMFLFFVSDCVGFMTSQIHREDDFWHKLEKSIGNEISLDDETLQCKNEGNEISLFNYLEEQLEKSEEQGNVEEEGKSEVEEEGKERKIKLLIVKAKLIYLLQNYHYF